MDNDFQIPVMVGGKEVCFNARVIPSGYVQKIQVDIYGEQIIYEPDEEGAYRALVNPEQISKEANISVLLLKDIAEIIESVRS